MSKTVEIIAGLLIVLVVLQFVSSTGNNGTAYGPNDITRVMPVPDTVKHLLESSCFDCHSNHTNYMWYSSVQPVGLWIGHHINEGREDLNFSEFKTYKDKKKIKKLQAIEKQLKGDKMPISSYLFEHRDAQLSDGQKQILIAWADSASASLNAVKH